MYVIGRKRKLAISTISSIEAAKNHYSNKPSTSSHHHHATTRYASEKPIISVSVLDKWPDQLQITEENQNMLRKEQQQQQKMKELDLYCSGISLSSSIKKRRSDPPQQQQQSCRNSSPRNSASLKNALKKSFHALNNPFSFLPLYH